MPIRKQIGQNQYNLSSTPWRAGKLSRRQVLHGAAVLGGAAMMPKIASASTPLSWIGWDGYQADSVIGSFVEANDLDINFQSLTDPGGTFAQLVAGAFRDFDLVVNDVPWIQRMGAANVCEFLDAEEFGDAFDNFYPQFQQPFEPLLWDGQITGVPTRWGWVGMNLNTDFADPDDWQSYAPVFDPANRDKIGILDFGDWSTFQVILYAGINPFEELGPAELNEIRQVFRALFRNTRLITADLVQAQRAMLDGSALIFLAGGNYLTSGLRKDGNMNIVSYVPEPIDGLQQGVIWLEGAAVSRGASEPELAKELIKHLVSTEAGQALCWTEWSAAPVPNAAVEPLLTDEQRSVIDVDNMWTYFDNALTYQIAPNIDDILTIWQEELSG